MEELTKLELTFTAERESPVYKAIEEAYAKDVVVSCYIRILCTLEVVCGVGVGVGGGGG